MKAGATTLDNPHFQTGHGHLTSAKKIVNEKPGYKTPTVNKTSALENQSQLRRSELKLLFGDDMKPSITDIKQG